MGRTIPSFRLASVEERKEWKEFRKALDKSDRKAFDAMFDIAHLYNSALFLYCESCKDTSNFYVHYLSSLQTTYNDC